MLTGQIKEVGNHFYNTSVEVDILREESIFNTQHVVMRLKFQNTAFKPTIGALVSLLESLLRKEASRQSSGIFVARHSCAGRENREFPSGAIGETRVEYSSRSRRLKERLALGGSSHPVRRQPRNIIPVLRVNL